MFPRMELLPTREVARRLGKSTSTVARWVEQGVLVPVVKGDGIRGAMWFTREDVDALRDDTGDTGSAA